jgi:hypothetical protein
MKRVKKSLKLLGATLLVGLATGCATPPIPGASQDLLKFLHIGATTRQEVLLKLGQPSAAFEQEKILTYRLGEDNRQGYFVVSPKAALPWQTVRYSLVLVFDTNGMLQSQSLVEVQ